MAQQGLSVKASFAGKVKTVFQMIAIGFFINGLAIWQFFTLDCSIFNSL